MEPGKLISLEGIDGSGKSTCASLLCQKLNPDKKIVFINRKSIPTTNEYIELHMKYIYAILWGKGEVFSKAPNVEYNGLNPEHWRHLMIAWYSAFEQHMIFPILEKGVSIITDGYIYKEIVKSVYSTGKLETAKEFDFLYKPDIVFYLTASPDECQRDASHTSRVEAGTFVDLQNNFVKHQTKMKAIYDQLAADNHWITIVRDKDANRTCNEIIKAYQNLNT